VKAQSLTHVAESISPLLDKDTSVVTAMNGVPWWFFDRLKFGNGRERLESLDPGGRLSRAMPTGRIVGCVIHLAASTPEPGLISHNMGKRLILGEPGGANTARTRRIAEALAAAGFEAVASEFIEKEFWVKLLGNVSFNPVSALTMTTADRLIEDREIKAYMVQIMREVRWFSLSTTWASPEGQVLGLREPRDRPRRQMGVHSQGRPRPRHPLPLEELGPLREDPPLG